MAIIRPNIRKYHSLAHRGSHRTRHWGLICAYFRLGSFQARFFIKKLATNRENFGNIFRLGAVGRAKHSFKKEICRTLTVTHAKRGRISQKAERGSRNKVILWEGVILQIPPGRRELFPPPLPAINHPRPPHTSHPSPTQTNERAQNKKILRPSAISQGDYAATFTKYLKKTYAKPQSVVRNRGSPISRSTGIRGAWGAPNRFFDGLDWRRCLPAYVADIHSI